MTFSKEDIIKSVEIEEINETNKLRIKGYKTILAGRKSLREMTVLLDKNEDTLFSETDTEKLRRLVDHLSLDW